MTPTVFPELLKSHSCKGSSVSILLFILRPNIVLSLLLKGNFERNITAVLAYI